jgi:hypothetical protein
LVNKKPLAGLFALSFGLIMPRQYTERNIVLASFLLVTTEKALVIPEGKTKAFLFCVGDMFFAQWGTGTSSPMVAGCSCMGKTAVPFLR